MPMPPIEFHVAMFRDERDQARSQYVLLFLMEALCRVNQSLIRDGEEREKRFGRPGAPAVSGDSPVANKRWPLLYRAGVHYEREPPGQEHWPDLSKILTLFDGPGQYPGPWADCEDLSCWRVAELREAAQHKDDDGALVKGGVKARPFAKWRRGPEGQFNYHALVLRPDGKIEDPSLVLGMRSEAQFAADGTAAKLKTGTVKPVIQFAQPPDVMVVDPDSPSGFLNRTDAAGVVGKPSAPKTGVTDDVHGYGRARRPRVATTRERLSGWDRTVSQLPRVSLNEAQRKLLEGTISSYGELSPEADLDRLEGRPPTDLVGDDPNTDYGRDR